MAVLVESLTKVYGDQRVVDGISFEVRDGEILGFLGPNGAGKSTTMKMITGYLEPESGRVSVLGLDVSTQGLESRRQIGYLPEHNPLYLDMYVREYLEWVARFYDIRDIPTRVKEMVSMVGLDREQHKKIGQLSKGYRQRVGLAQALIHDPKVLILDEPTAGLDPNQLSEVRQLIRSLGKKKTIILSTHIMQEVTALCDRVVIINKGKIVADGSVNDLERKLRSGQVLIVRTDKPSDGRLFERVNGVNGVEKLEGGKMFRLLADPDKDVRAGVFQLAAKEGLVLTELRVESRGVEEVFQELTREKR